MTDSEKLCLLADWIDKKYPNDRVPEVQVDLRRIAAQLAESTKPPTNTQRDGIEWNTILISTIIGIILGIVLFSI